jgi:hypothetical protein
MLRGLPAPVAACVSASAVGCGRNTLGAGERGPGARVLNAKLGRPPPT